MNEFLDLELRLAHLKKFDIKVNTAYLHLLKNKGHALFFSQIMYLREKYNGSPFYKPDSYFESLSNFSCRELCAARKKFIGLGILSTRRDQKNKLWYTVNVEILLQLVDKSGFINDKKSFPETTKSRRYLVHKRQNVVSSNEVTTDHVLEINNNRENVVVLLREMDQLKIETKIKVRLIDEYGNERIKSALDLIKGSKNVKNPEGLFLTALKKNYQITLKSLRNELEETREMLKSKAEFEKEAASPKCREAGYAALNALKGLRGKSNG